MDIENWIKEQMPNLYNSNDIKIEDVVQAISSYAQSLKLQRSEQLFCQCTKPAIWETEDGFNGCVKCNKEVKIK